ncbi:MAG: cytochrome c oxidase subunit II [Dehalococcoidia bacterium]|nr:cytochrome c oxidase subunit II [Dehalococcoidia bacterium]
MTRHFVSLAVLWVFVTAVVETLLFVDLFPTVGSEFAQESDDIVRYLLAIGIPVFAMAVSVIIYAMFQFRAKEDTETGAGFRGTGLFPKAWLVVTGGMAAAVMIYPGLIDLAKLQNTNSGSGWGEVDNIDLEVSVTGFRWAWQFEYPEYGITLLGNTEPLVIPADERVRFSVDSTDVVHSFWVPAWRLKIDAIPGRTTFITVTPDKEGWSNWKRFPQWSDETEGMAGESDDSFRVQCAELCGSDHGFMRFDLRVVSREEFDQWVADKQAQAQAKGN